VLRSRSYLLAVLFAVYVFNNSDGLALGLVLQDIKRDLSLTDTQLGLLTGIAFSLMYSLVGLAVARWADRGDRVAIISLAAAVWSVLVAACGAATNFMHLFLLRVGVGIGEAGCVPASESLIADYFDRAERPLANGVYGMAAGVACLVGYGLGGWLNEFYDWRVMFMILGLPGLALAALAWFTLREPRFERSGSSEAVGRFARASRSLLKTTASASAQLSLKETAAALWSKTTLRHLLLFWSVWGFTGSGVFQWLPAFFVRSYGLNTGELGTWFAVLVGSGGTLGPLLGGVWASRYAANNERLQLRAGAVAFFGLTILSPFIYLSPNYYLPFGLLGLYVVVSTAFCSSFWAMIQTLVPESMRATATAILSLLGYLVGGGLGSLATGALSDAFLSAHLEAHSLRYALLALWLPGFLWAAWHLWQASKSVTRDLAAAQEQHYRCGGQSHGVRISPGVGF
jgi:MFS family permease